MVLLPPLRPGPAARLPGPDPQHSYLPAAAAPAPGLGSSACPPRALRGAAWGTVSRPAGALRPRASESWCERGLAAFRPAGSV